MMCVINYIHNFFFEIWNCSTKKYFLENVFLKLDTISENESFSNLSTLNQLTTFYDDFFLIFWVNFNVCPNVM